ncbi:hypothetical protein J5X84_41725 [Streptosporangiaceae bacterium NEAU-GS5]|nr:hypothetical protein [Streptosporangiaceae bacterium NEAU-GS5]
MAGALDLAATLFGQLSDAERATLQRCAAVRRFEPGLYESVLRGDGGQELTELVADGWVEPLTSATESYRIDPSLRRCAWERWWVDEDLTPGATVIPAALARLAGRLAVSVGDDLEELRQLILFAPAQAAGRFIELYRDADAAFDLVRCQDLIDVLISPELAHLVPVELAALREERQARLSARGMWAAEYRQSGRYIGRRDIERALASLTSGTSRVVQLHAPGGMGKTMQLRWFIARHCLTAERLVPCAKIDMDAIDPVNAVRYPWLLLLEVAGQLNPQMPGAPFQELLRDHDRYRRALRRTASPDTALLGEIASATADGEEVVRRFLGILGDLSGLVVVVFDTLEEMLLRPVADPAAISDLLRRLHDAAPSIRLVLSGRYDLRDDQRTRFAERFPDAISILVPVFTAEEARRYLVERRGVREDLVEVMTRQSGGLPFSLALFGDLAAANPAVTAEEVAQARDPALLYCLDRILERIPDDRLRWLLRYGVVPRRLDLDFVGQVLRPELRRATAGDTAYDDPSLDGRPPDRMEIFLPAPRPVEASDLSSLWDDLIRYASATSWVSPAGPDAVTFHESLRGPVREFLRGHEVYERLHEAAHAYFLGRADAEPALWSQWTREAVYHLFHVRGPAAIEFWRERVAGAWSSGHPDWAGELAADLLSADYKGPSDEPLAGVIDRQAWYEANVELARVAVNRARRQPEAGAAGASWNEAEGCLASATLLVAGGVPASSLHHALAAAIHYRRGRSDDALMEIMEAEDAGITPEAEAEIFLVRLTSEDPATLAEAYSQAVTADDQEQITAAASALSRSYMKAGDLDLAARWSEEAGDRAGLARVLLREGRPEAALHALDAVDAVDARSLPDEAALIAADALRALRRPLAAVQLLVGRANPPAMSLRIAAALRDLYEHDDALGTLASARRRATLEDDRAALALESVRIHLRVTGDLRLARQAFTEAASYVLDADAPAYWDLDLLRSENDLARDVSLDIGAFVDAAVAQGDPVLAVRAALASLRRDARASHVQVLIAGLRQLSGTGERLALLRDLRHCAPFPAEMTYARGALTDEVLDPWLAERDQAGPRQYLPTDRAYLDLAAAEVARVAGRGDAVWLAQAGARTLAERDPLSWLDWVEAADRIGPPHPGEPEPPAALLSTYRDRHLLCATYLVRLTRRRLGVDPRDVSEQRLEQARITLDQAGSPLVLCGAELRAVQSRLARMRNDAAEAALHDLAGVRVLQELGRSPDEILELGRATRAPEPRARPVPPVSAQEESIGALRERSEPASTDPPRIREIGVRLAYSGKALIEEEIQVGDERSGRRIPLPGWIPPAGSRPGSYGAVLINSLRTPLQWGSDAARQIFDRVTERLAALPDANGPVDVGLMLDDPQLAAVPWELAEQRLRPANADLRCLYRRPPEEEARRIEDTAARGLLEVAAGAGMAAEDSAAVERDLRDRRVLTRQNAWRSLRTAARGGRPPHVLVLQPGRTASIKLGRGTTGSQNDVAATYDTAGVRITVGDMRYPGDWDVRAVDAIHLCATIERSGRSPILSFFDNVGLETFDLVALAQRFGGPAPFIVLDLITPPTEGERIEQLLLRNHYAHATLSLGKAVTILATGLTLPDDRSTLLTGIAEGIKTGLWIPELAHRLRSRTGGPDHLGMASIALFSTLPAYAMPRWEPR